MVPECDATLKNWRKHVCMANGAFVIWGQVYNDRKLRFPDGDYIHTAEVSQVIGNRVVTKNGTVYNLEGESTGPEVNPWNF